MRKMQLVLGMAIVGIIGFGFVTPVHAAVPTPTNETKSAELIEMIEASKSTTDAPQIRLEYSLPYPGILPDHPLYFLKKFRDQVVESLIADPVRKDEFYILQSDKDVNAGVFLQAKGKTQLAEVALTQAQAHLRKAIDGLTLRKNAGTEIPGGVIDHLEKAIAKHKEVLVDLMKTGDDSFKSFVNTTIEDLNKFGEDVSKLK